MDSFPVRLFQVKMEREQHQTEIRDLQDQLSEMHDELDSAKRSEDREKGALIEVSELWSQVTRQAPLPEGDEVVEVGQGLGAVSRPLFCALAPPVPMVRFSKSIICGGFKCCRKKTFNHIER